VSRLEFRAELALPRPLSAVVLVALADATLFVSGQILPPVAIGQLALLVLAVWRRERPFGWQRSGTVLNLGLAACLAAALALAALGMPLQVALAHFALLAAGLQLLDARPRRSEFLLVALALFQVVLASSLTDSLLFPPLLMAFLPTCVWTLMVHTLRTEALEAGDPGAARAVITPGLMGTTLVASLCSMAVAMVLFFLLPRLHEGLVPGGAGAGQALGGFSDRVELGDLGRIRGDPTVMLRVETLAGEVPPAREAYWRGLAFDHFDGRSWSISLPVRDVVVGDPRLGIRLAPSGLQADRVRRVVREPVAAGVVFDEGRPVAIEGGTGRLERDANGGLYAPRTASSRVRYELASAGERPSSAALAGDRAAPPRGGARYLQLPPLSPELALLAREVTADAGSDFARATALERWLRRNGRYSDTPPPLPRDGRTPIDAFLLGDRAGHCEYFATAMALMARTLGLPARLVNGFAGGRENPVGGFRELTGSDAHAWVEVHFARHGWVRFDPTPPDLRLAAATGLSLGERLEQLRSALELLWFRNVVEYDRARQVGVMVSALRALRGLGNAEGAGRDDGPTSWLERMRALPLGPVAAAAAAVAALALLWRGLARRGPGPARRLPAAYARALRLLERHGLARAPGVTPRAFAAAVADRLPAAGATAFARLTEAYLRERWGAEPAGACQAELRALRDSLRA